MSEEKILPCSDKKISFKNLENITKTNNLPITLQKMVFVYNAILNGWTVRMISEDNFEFKKNTTKEVNLENYLRKFLEYNMNIENIM